MSKDKAPPRGPQQSLLPSPEAREKFRRWHQQFREQQTRGGNPIDKLSRSEAVQAFIRAQQDQQSTAMQAEQDTKQASGPKRATGRKGVGGRKPMPPELAEAAKQEYRQALKKDGRLSKHEAAVNHLNAWFATSRWKEVTLPSPSSFERHVIRPVLAEQGRLSFDCQNSTAS